MSEHTQLHSIGTLRNLLTTLDGWDPNSTVNTAFLATLDGLPVNLADKRESAIIIHEFQSFCSRKDASVFQISNFEFAFLTELDADDSMEKNADLKIMLLGIVQNLYPQFFQEMDQSRLVRRLFLPDRLENFKAYVDSRHNQSVGKVREPAITRKLAETDLALLENFFSQKSPEEVAEQFIARQPIYLYKENEPLKPVTEEFFISMEAVKKQVLQNIDFRGNSALFSYMTLYLDKILLRALHHVPNRNLPISLNLNVENVFSNEFKTFMKRLGEKNLEHIQIEFRQADILLNIDKYNLIGRILSEYQGSTVIDAVFANTIGLIRMDRLAPSFVKIFWQSDSDAELREKSADIAEIRNANIFPVLARIDDEAGFKLGQELGIKLYQGFYFDRLAKGDPA